MRLIIAAALAATALTACSSEPETVAEDAPAYSARQYSSAINDIARTEEDRAADANRQPGELLAFAQIDKGEVVGDYFMGGGYVTRLLAMAVGSNGKVYAFQPEEFIAMYPTLAEDQDDAVAPYADDQGNPTRVFPLRGPAAEPGFPEPLDAIITVMNYHDLFLPSFPEGTAEAASQALFDALRPGGVLIVADHLALGGSGAEAADSVHRMDSALALETLEAAGFVLEEESDLYTRPDDPRDVSVFDESIRGSTDQFLWRLRKPES